MPFFDKNSHFFQILPIFGRFFTSNVINFVDMCFYTLNVSHEAVKIVKIGLMAEKCPKNVQKKSKKVAFFFCKNSPVKVFEKILASVGTIWHLIPFGIYQGFVSSFRCTMIIICAQLCSQLFLSRFSKILTKNSTKIWCCAKNQDYEVATQFFLQEFQINLKITVK